MDPYGLRRVVAPRGVLPQRADVVDPTLPLGDDELAIDATDAVGALARVEAEGGPFDLVVNCASVPGTEMASILCVRDGGTVVFFSMATSFTAAALGAEGVGKDVHLVMGNGYVPGHAALTPDLLRNTP